MNLLSNYLSYVFNQHNSLLILQTCLKPCFLNVFRVLKQYNRCCFIINAIQRIFKTIFILTIQIKYLKVQRSCLENLFVVVIYFIINLLVSLNKLTRFKCRICDLKGACFQINQYNMPLTCANKFKYVLNQNTENRYEKLQLVIVES